jgi:hypothetical protein
VLPFPNNLYARWRAESGALPLLREQSESPPERLLQAVWQHQRLRRDQLKSLDGKIVRVLHPGFLSREGGPDFRHALIQIDDAAPRSGDVEVDIHAGGWRAHGHDRNPAFAGVILHVIWRGEPSGAAVPPGRSSDETAGADRDAGRRRAPPTVELRNALDAPIADLAFWLNTEPARGWPSNLCGSCAAALRQLPPERLERLLRDAGQIRFRSKAEQLHARARQVGWEQALWEGLFRALGYKHNAWPMQCLAEQRAAWWQPEDSALVLQARLLGLGNLLPFELPRMLPSARQYLGRVWEHWWRERELFQDHVLPASLWRFHGQRPSNHPQRRLALAAHWLADRDLPLKLQRWCAQPVADSDLPRSLLELLQVEQDDFWSWHWTLRSPRLAKPRPLLGDSRVTDLAVNAILPWLWSRAAEGGSSRIGRAMEHRFQVWPAAQDNAVLRLTRQRLLNGAPIRRLPCAAEQQGLIQISRDFCDQTDARCRGCRFPQRVREWAG